MYRIIGVKVKIMMIQRYYGWKLLFNDNNFQGGTDTITVKNNSKFILKINEIFDKEFLKKHNFYIKLFLIYLIVPGITTNI